MKSDELVPVAPDLLKNLFKTMDFPGSEENEYVMKGNTNCKIIESLDAKERIKNENLPQTVKSSVNKCCCMKWICLCTLTASSRSACLIKLTHIGHFHHPVLVKNMTFWKLCMLLWYGKNMEHAVMGPLHECSRPVHVDYLCPLDPSE